MSGDEDALLKSVALKNANAIFAAQQRENEFRAHLAAVVESSDDAIISTSLEGVIQSWNNGARRTFGYEPWEAIGKNVQLLIPVDRINEEPVIIGRLKRGERVHHYQTIRLRKDGTPLDVSISVSPIVDAEGRLVGASKISRDITETKRMERALRDETTVLELLNKTGAMIASQLDLARLVQSVTDAATALSGAKFGSLFYTVTNRQGETFLLHTLSGAQQGEFEKVSSPRGTQLLGPTFQGLVGVVRSADITTDERYGKSGPHFGMPKGHLPVRSYLAVPVISRSGQVLGGLFFGHPEPNVFTERTERLVVGIAAHAAVAIDNARLYDDVKHAAEEREKLLEAERAARAEAEHASFMKDQFLATLSHELRTPLNAILGWSQILRSMPHEDEELAEGLSVIERNTRVQTLLIEDLLDMSRITAGKLRLDVQEVDVPEVVKAAIASVRHAAEARDIRLTMALDPFVGTVRGDVSRLQQCYWNLLSNAIKFTPHGGEVRVTLGQRDRVVSVLVKDNGQGIPSEFLPHVFERFRQADASTTRKHGGLGIGLSIVKHLVELHGGNVTAESSGEGLGATFRIELPLAPVMVEPIRETVSRSAKTSLKGITVLAVDDDPDARRLLRRILEDAGATVVLALTAGEAFESLLRCSPHMLLSDLGMPGEDGYELIKRIRALSPEAGGRIPAAALSAFARPEDRNRALLAGFHAHLAKPVEPAELTALIASLTMPRAG